MASLMSGDGVQFCPKDCCGGGKFIQDVLTIVATDIFCSDANFRSFLYARYEQMSDNFYNKDYDDISWDIGGSHNVVDEKKQDARLAVPQSLVKSDLEKVARLFDYYNFGHDLPVWLVADGVHDINHCPRVMILSEDPLRDGDDNGFLYLSTPFGVHCHSFRRQQWDKETGYPLKLAENIVNAGGAVWMSDFMKFFAYEKRKHEKDDDKRLLNPIRKYYFVEENGLSYEGLFQYCLHREIEVFKPDIIITLGSDAAEGVRKTYASLNKGLDITLGLKVKEFRTGQNIFRKLITSYHPSSHGNVCANALPVHEEHTKQRYFEYLSHGVTKAMMEGS